jgi:hypothetical protein
MVVVVTVAVVVVVMVTVAVVVVVMVTVAVVMVVVVVAALSMMIILCKVKIVLLHYSTLLKSCSPKYTTIFIDSNLPLTLYR